VLKIRCGELQSWQRPVVAQVMSPATKTAKPLAINAAWHCSSDVNTADMIFNQS
jgi:hypothetical protein